MKRLQLTILAVSLILIGLSPVFAGSQGQYPAYSGNRRVAVMMLAWQDKACPDTRQNIVNKIWNNNQSLRKYFLAMSRNVLDCVPPADAAADGTVPASTSSVYGPYVLSKAAGFDKDITYANVESYYGSPEGSVYLSNAHPVARDLAAARDGFKASNYDYIIYVTPKGPSTGSVGGYASYHGSYMHIYVAKQNYINHEMGHSLGLAHSNTGVDVNGYKSQDCIMGNTNNPHLDSVHSYNLGWNPDANFSVKSYGQYTIENLAQPDTDNLKVLRFDRGAHGATSNSTYNLWVAYRVGGIGHDSGLNSNWKDKVNIHYCRTGSPRPTDSNSTIYYNNNVSKFLVGGNYTDPDNVCKVRFLRKENPSAASAVVQLIDPDGNQPPTIPAQTITVTTGTSTFTIQTSDPENDTLSYTIVAQPAQGTLSVSGGTFTYTGSTIGTYSFTVRVNDGQYDSYDVVIPLEVIGINPPTADAGPDQTVTLSATPTPWTPAYLITKPAAWYDADDATTITASGGVVGQWADKSGNGNHLSGAGNPMTGTRGINGVNVIDFDGAGDELVNSAFSSISTGNISIFSVQQHDSISVQSMTAWALERSTDTQGMLFHSSYNTSFSLGQRYPENTSVGYTENTNVELISYVKSGAASQQGWVDGLSVGTQTGGVTAFTAQKLALGSRSGANYLNGAIGEFIVVPEALNDADRQKLEGYLAHKWGLTLPTGHLYESAAPMYGITAVATLAGQVDDLDGTTPTATWSVVSTDPAGLSVVFSNPSSPTTTALFFAAGTYTLRLTADDGLYQDFDDVVITVLDDTLVADAGPDQDVTDFGNDGSEEVTLDGSGSNDTVRTITSYVWTEGGAEIATGVNPAVTLAVGTHTITLAVTNDEGLTKEDTVVITVTEYNTAPDVTITVTPSTTVTLTGGAGGGDPVAGAYYEWDAAQNSGGNVSWASTTANVYNWTFAASASATPITDTRFDKLTHAYEFSAAKSQVQTTLEDTVNENSSATWEFVLNTDTDGLIMESGGSTDGIQFWIDGGVLKGLVCTDKTPATVSYTLTAEDKARFIHVVYVVDMLTDTFTLYVDDVEVDSVSYTGGDWCGPNEAGLGRIGNSAPTGSPADFSGKIALIRFYEDKAFTAAEVTKNFNSLSTGISATVNLVGTVTDAENDAYTTLWTVNEPAPGPVTFGDATLKATTATFTVAGTYTLRLSATDEHGLIGFREVTIIVLPSGPEILVTGKGVEIVSGSDTPNAADDTAFGTVTVGDSLTHTFTIQNDGTGPLTLGGTPTIEIVNSDGGTAFTVDYSLMDTTVAAEGGTTTFTVTFAPTVENSGDVTATVTIANDDADENPYIFVVGATVGSSLTPVVVATHIFYNDSAHDGDAEASVNDDKAIATDKLPLLAGGTATLANYTSYVKGINGIMIDVENLVGVPTATNFAFSVGNDANTAGWGAAAAPTSITVRAGAGFGGSDRITIIWADGAIQKTWLQVTVKAGGTIGLDSDTVFHYGNAVGETGNDAGGTAVDVFDMLGARNGVTETGAATIENKYDFNRDTSVDVYDMLGARNNVTDSGSELKLISLP